LNPLVYEFGRTIRSKSLILVILVTVLISGALIPFIKSASAPVSAAQGGNDVLVYRTQDGYHILIYSFDKFGQAISGATVKVTVEGKTSVFKTNGSGYVQAFLASVKPFTQIGLNFSYSFGSSFFTPTLPNSSIGSPQPLTQLVTPVVDTQNTSLVDVLVFFAAPFGEKPVNYSVYAMLSKSPTYQINKSAMTFVGVLKDYHQVFRLPFHPSPTQFVVFAIFQPNGTYAFGDIVPGLAFQVSRSTISKNQLLTSFVSGILAFFVPIMSILASYSTYGKDRVTGVLESVLVRAVSRRGLASIRYAAVACALAFAIAVMFGAIEVIAKIFLGSFLDLEYSLSSFYALLVEALVFSALVFLFSHVVKSTGALIGLSIVLWAVFEFFWGLISLLVSQALGYTIGSAGFFHVIVVMSYFNPADYYGLVATYLTKTLVAGPFSANGALGNLGVTPLTLALDAILWLATPLVAYFYLATRRD
jgi:ABC-2 type transport system permease protein